jgi:peptidoglycan/LPS O-acetylase OafA/YrhL
MSGSGGGEAPPDGARAGGPKIGGLASGGRIPSLDGLRGISISLVLLGHINGTRNAPDLGFMHAVGDAANMGVRVFFVISGLLITSLLIEEAQRSGRISLPMFYLRRTFRIFPAYYALLLVVWIGAALGKLELKDGDLLHAVTYTTNFHYDRAWYLGHTWSLAVEEQFYLLWPAAIVVAGLARAPFIAAGVLVVSPVCRALIMRYVPSWRVGVGESFPTIADSLAIGCLLAFVRDRLWADPRYRRALAWGGAPLALLAVILVLNRLQSVLAFSLTVGESLENLAIALLVERSIRTPGDLTGRLLNSRGLVWIGLLSYSIYLWQQLLLNRNSDAWYNAFPVNAILVAPVAVASYYLIEMPLIDVRRKVEKRLRARPASAPSA